MTMTTRFSAIFIHRNGFERLKSAIDSAINALSSIDEIIIVDNASSDNSSIDISKIYPNIKIIHNSSNLGFGHAANQGMNVAQGEYFLICNNDIILPQNIFNDLHELFKKEPKAGIISGQQTNLNGENIRTSSDKPSLVSEFDGIGRVNHSKDPQKISKVGILRGACLGVRKKMTEDIGGYDEDFFFYFEDTEWCIRANNHGWKVLLNPKIRVAHIGGASSNEFYSESRIEFYRSRIIFWKKVFPVYIVILLHIWNIPKLSLDLVFYSIISFINLGKNTRINKKMIDRAIVLLWLSLGKPKSWGLPKKIIE